MTSDSSAVRRFFHIPASGNPVLCPDPGSALAALERGGYIWLNFLDPSREELESLMGPLGLHPLAIEDCLDDMQIPKIEDYPTNTFILFNRFRYLDHELAIDEIDLFLGKNFIIMVGHNLHGAESLLDQLEQRSGLERENALHGPDYILHVILDYLVDDKFHTIETLQEELDGIEEKIIGNTVSFRADELLRLRRNLLALRKCIIYEREILVKICRRDSPFVTEESIYHFRDIYDHLAKFFEEAEIYRDLISSFMEMYLSLMNNSMTMAANRTNLGVRRLTLITVIFMPLTLLAGIGGMSEWSMMTGAQNWKLSYPLFLLLMAVIGVAVYFVVRKFEDRDLD